MSELQSGIYVDFRALRAWKWDGQSVAAILAQRPMLSTWPEKIKEWANTVPPDMRDPVIVQDKNPRGYTEERVLARVIAVDAKGEALVSRMDAGECRSAYSVMPVEDARTFINKCREQLDAESEDRPAFRI